MDIPRGPGTPIRVRDSHIGHGSRRSSNRSSLSDTRGISLAPGPVAIPGVRENSPPPPLPPPRHLHDIAAGGDPGYYWENIRKTGDIGTHETGSVSPGSSLCGNWGRNMKRENIKEEGNAERPGYTRHGSSTSRIRSQATEMRYDIYPHRDEGYHSLSGSSLANNKLHGESLLGRRNLENSSQAYDKGLLSKFGRPRTPPKSSTLGSVNTSPISGTPFYQDPRQYPQLKALSISEGQLSISSGSPFRVGSPTDMYNSSPRSVVISPGLISTAASAKSYMEFRNPIYGNKSPPPSAVVPERRREHMTTADDRHSSTRSMLPNLAVGASYASEAKRGSYEQPFFAEPDSDFPMEETGALRQLHLEDRHRTPPSMDSHNHQHPLPTDSRATGMKRRASSEATREEKAPLLAVGGNEQRRTSNHLSAHYNQGSPVNRFTSQHGSISSQSSGSLMNSSYASSGGLSLGGSSMTSISSTHDRLSPSALSPSYDQHQPHESSYITSIPIDPATQEPFQQTAQSDSSDPQPAMMARRLPSDLSNQAKISGGPQLQAHMHICACCPKKPKKFDTEEELRVHTSEKQYECTWCKNRFKNKNEMERHQNSLHLRRHSWSCATLGTNFQSAFHASTSIPPPNTNPNNPIVPQPPPDLQADHDVCGYCGKQFSNVPTPNWDERIVHLTNTHKFGECNQSKKFFRADHFRQHLKHSHAGTSGKWTNMLEAACMKEEPAPQATDNSTPPQQQQTEQQQHQQYPQHPQPQQHMAPVANMGGQAMGSSQMSTVAMSGQHIDGGHMGMGQPGIPSMDMGYGVPYPSMHQGRGFKNEDKIEEMPHEL